MNITTCQKCNKDLISEELDQHQCKPLQEYKIIDDILWVSDGTRWYPLKLTNRDFTPSKSTAEWTEPGTRFCKVSVGNFY